MLTSCGTNGTMTSETVPPPLHPEPEVRQCIKTCSESFYIDFTNQQADIREARGGS